MCLEGVSNRFFLLNPKSTQFKLFSLQALVFFDINIMVLFCGLERTHIFFVPINNPPFADNSPHLLLQKNLSSTRLKEGISHSSFQKPALSQFLEEKKFGENELKEGYNAGQREGLACNLLFFFKDPGLLRLSGAKFFYFLMLK